MTNDASSHRETEIAPSKDTASPQPSATTSSSSGSLPAILLILVLGSLALLGLGALAIFAVIGVWESASPVALRTNGPPRSASRNSAGDTDFDRLLSDPSAALDEQGSVRVGGSHGAARGSAQIAVSARVEEIPPQRAGNELVVSIDDEPREFDPLDQLVITPEFIPPKPPPRPVRRSTPPTPQPRDENWGVAQPINLADLGAALANGPALSGDGRRVLVKDESGRLVVAKVHVKVDDRIAVLLPDGQLLWLPEREATATTRPFSPLKKDELITRLTDEEFPGFKKGTTKRYIYIYNTSDAFYEATHSILETMYPKLVSFCERQGLSVDEPELPMVVLMFRTETEFQQYRRMPSGVVAYYDILRNCVVMYEQSRLSEVAPQIAIKQSITTIAHEGVHQILHNIGVQQRLSRWPMWISEGLPEYCAPTSVDRRIRWKGVGTVNDLRMHSLQDVLRSFAPGQKSDGSLVRQTITAERLDADGYAVAWALTFYLAKSRPDDFAAYLQAVSVSKPLAEPKRNQLDVFQEHFGDDLGEIQDKMLAALRSAK
jgi:hypothetical protein